MALSDGLDRKTLFGWCMYDFANSAFSTLILTFIYSFYYVEVIAPDSITGTALWSRGLTVSALVVAFLSPFMGALADSGGFRKRLLVLMTLIAFAASASLSSVLPGDTIKGLLLFVIANIGIEMGMVFYNAFLPDIAPPDRIGRVSGYGWSLGYAGGLLAMVLVLVLLITPEKPILGFNQTSKTDGAEVPRWRNMSAADIENNTGFQVVEIQQERFEIRGLVLDSDGDVLGIKVLRESTAAMDTLDMQQIAGLPVSDDSDLLAMATESDNNIRATSLLVAAWLLLFSIPTFLWVKEKAAIRASEKAGLFSATLQSLRVTVHEIRKYRQIVRLLIARIFYNDALLTIFSFGSIYAAGTFGFTLSEIMIFGIVLNITAGAGAFALGFLDDRIGGKRTIQLSNFAFIVAVTIAVFAPGKTLFWCAGILIGLFSGPNQAASRSLMSRFVPEHKETEFFGFYALSGKATAFAGPLILGLVTQVFDSQRIGVAVLIVLFLVGILLLSRVDEAEGRRLSGRFDRL